MNRITRILTLFMVVVALMGLGVGNVNAQGRITTTTLSSAMTAAQTSMVIASATGWTASSGLASCQYLAYVDYEAMCVTAVNGTTISVTRGRASTRNTSHASGAYVLFGAAGSATNSQSGSTVVTGGPFVATTPRGSCTRNQNATLPLVNTVTGEYINCNGGQWVVQTNISSVQNTPLVAACNVQIGDVAYASVGTDTTDIADKRMTTSIYVPYTVYATGIQVLMGSAPATDNLTGQLADASGKVFAPGAAAGVLTAGANTFLNLPFANAQLITGPALYFASIVGNGTDANNYRTVATATYNNITSQGTTSITFGTFPDFSPPTTFTADLAPVACIYR